MIKTPTVFVLGAGASKPYGYPDAMELRALVLQGLKGKQPEALRCMDAENLRQMGAQCAIALENVKGTSVDAFLEHRREFTRVGKVVMAYELLCCEDHNKVFSEKGIEGDWLAYLLPAMEGTFDTFGDNAVSFVTFNYDRLLEHALFTTVKHRYNLSDEDCAAVLEMFPIVHVHGSLGPLPWQDTEGRPYGGPLQPQHMSFAADRIKIVYEGAEWDPEFDKARELISTAHRIYFLGFGYYKDNVERLHLGKCRGGAGVFGTAFKFSPREIQDVYRLLNAQIDPQANPRPVFEIINTECYDFLRNDPVRLD